MTTLAAALILALVPQDEARLKENWSKLQEAWKAVEAYKPPAEAALFDDELLKTAAKLHGAFEAAGLYTKDGEYLPQAVKALVKIKSRQLFPGAGSNRFGAGRAIVRVIRGGGGGGPEESTVEGDPLAKLIKALKKLESLKDEGLDDEENVQDEMAAVRKSLKGLGIIGDDTPPALRRRALRLVKAMALGEEYPATLAATDEQAKQFRTWISELGSEAIETREKAMKELMRTSEASLPFLREGAKSGDAEVATRSRQLLGVGHAPWTKLKAPVDEEGVWMDMIFPAPAAPPPPEGEKEKEKK